MGEETRKIFALLLLTGQNSVAGELAEDEKASLPADSISRAARSPSPVHHK